MALEHINTFEKGMTKDCSILLQPDGTYRHMVNCSLVSQDGNNFVIKDCLGNLQTFSINIPYNAVYTVVGTIPMPIGFISFPDKLIVFSTNNSSTGGYGEIGIIKTLPYGEGIQPDAVAGQYNSGYVPLYHHDSLLFTKKQRIEGFGFTENELIERIYWTDNFNNPRVFNVSDPTFTTYIATGSLVTTTQYMVLEGAVTHNTVNYGPGLTAGNVFTAANANYTALTGTSPTPKVVVYYPYQLLDFTPSRALGNIQFASFGSGNVYCGNKMYFYRLGTSQGVYTSWSYGSYMVPVGTENIPYTPTGFTYHDWDGAGTNTTLFDSTKSVNVKIENIDTNFDFIQLAVAEFDQSINLPRQTAIVEQSDITGTTMTLAHTGNKYLGAVTLDNLLLFPASIIKCKTLATSKNYILAGNITERAELDIDLSAATITSFQYPMNVLLPQDNCAFGGSVYDPFSPLSGGNVPPGNITPYSRYLVTSVAGGPVEYPVASSVFYALGQVFTGVSGSTSATIPGASQVRPCVTRNRYTTTLGVRRENAIELVGDSCFWDYKSAAVHQHVSSYWSNETYRLGAMYFDLKGNPFYVRHLGDFKMPDINSKNGLIRKDTYAGGDFYSLNPSLISISNLIIPASIIDQISGFSIVRAVREPRIVTQGLVTQCVTDGGSPATYNPGSYVPISKDSKTVVSKVYSYICPDQLVGLPLKSSIGINGDTMESACWLDSFKYGGESTKADGGEELILTKFIEPLNADATLRTSKITYFNYVDEGQSLTDLGAGVSFNNNLEIGVGTAPDDGCISTGPYNLNNHRGAGGKKIVFELDNDFLAYNTANDYTSVAANGQTEKVLMNYVKTGFSSSPYGGTGPDALANTTYISTGHYQPITAAVKTDTLSGGNYIFNNIEIGGGDCFPSLIDYGYGLWDNTYAGGVGTYSYGWLFPCECNSNYNLRKGRKTSNVGMYFTDSGDGPAGAESIVYDPPAGDPRLEDYSYNQGYSSEDLGNLLGYPALPVNFINSNKFQVRVRWAGPKFFGETINSFRIFGTNDSKDLDASGGEINNIKIKDGRVIVWQNKLTSTIPILERQLLGAPDGSATTIGTGGVVDRFDPLTSYFGNQHQWSLIETEFGFCWFDMRRKAFMVMTTGGGILEASQVQGLKSYFDEIIVEAIGNNVIDATNLLNSPTYAATSDQPLMGVGITGVYDPKFKMTYMTLKFMARKVITVNSLNANGYWAKDFTIGYLHSNTMKSFVGFYDFYPAISHNHNQFVISVNNPKNVTQYTTTDGSYQTFAVGETLPSSNKEYICKVAVTLDDPVKLPEGASGSTYWTLINQTNQLWVHNQPSALAQTTAPDYLYNMFFGKVVPNEVQFVINPKASSFSASHYEMKGNSVNYTDITIDAESQSASDLNIKSWNKYFRFIYDRITANFPLSTTGRVTNSYIKVKFVKKNYDTVPTTLINTQKILQYVKSYLIPKR